MSLTDEEKKIRATGVGASEVASLVGLNPYQSPMALWLKKRGLVDDEQREAAEWGNILEPVIARKWAETRNATLVKGTTLRHPMYPHVLATPDYLTALKPEGEVLEAKTAGLRMANQWGKGGDEIPEAYLVQVQMQLAVTMRPIWNLAALIGGQNYIEYEGEADMELQAGLCDAIENFWRNHVEADVPPAVDASDATRKWLASKFPRVMGEIREATEGEAALLKAYDDARRECRKWEDEKATIGATICKAIGDAKGITWSGSRATWTNRKAFTRPAVEIAAGRQLRVSVKDEDDNG